MMHLENLSYQRGRASTSVSVTLIAGFHYDFTGMNLGLTGLGAYLAMWWRVGLFSSYC